MIVPIIIGMVAVGGAAAYELLQKPKVPNKTAPPAPNQQLRGVAPPGATDQPAAPPVQNVVYNQSVNPTPQVAPASLTAAQINQQLANLASTPPASAASAAEVQAGLRATVQPQPSVGPAAKQPPLPPVPAAGIQSQRAMVNTNGAPGQDSNLRIRSGPSTNAPVIAGGEPSQGGGIPKGTIIDVTGPTVSDMTPFAWNGMTGWVYSGYLKPV